MGVCSSFTVSTKMASHNKAEKDVYHERQVKQMCAIHAINNILQSQAFQQKDIDKICEEYVLSLSDIINPNTFTPIVCSVSVCSSSST